VEKMVSSFHPTCCNLYGSQTDVGVKWSEGSKILFGRLGFSGWFKVCYKYMLCNPIVI
jgi:hypothetical protein